ncbi:hypothetical protein PRUPE_7G179800 [Prunus persica]|uniref:Uncharacterized protein n=1 Tax=Prunus persica TaxID=3760 RepID=A0A251ND48_PRUPE|nr:hypothetical protein PRUPE_7G179800 [Prunus persica]
MDEIRVDLPPSYSIYFMVGIINKKLDVDQFQKCPFLPQWAIGFLSRIVETGHPVVVTSDVLKKWLQYAVV